jgi:hypothetical protein
LNNSISALYNAISAFKKGLRIILAIVAICFLPDFSSTSKGDYGTKAKNSMMFVFVAVAMLTHPLNDGFSSEAQQS